MSIQGTRWRGLLNNSGVPPRAQVNYARRPVFGQKVVNVLDCLLELGSNLVDIEAGTQGSWVSFWEDLEKEFGLTKDDVDNRAANFGGFVIGRSFTIEHPLKPANIPWEKVKGISLCTDLELVLAISSRVAGNLFLPRRPPDYSKDKLAGWQCVTDDPRISYTHKFKASNL